MTSVTSKTQDGYDYQYLITVYFTLLLSKRTFIDCVYVDKVNSEDFTIITRDQQGKPETWEVQVKMHGGLLDIGEFARFFTHFEEYSVSENILSKLRDGKVSVFFLVYGSRAKDFASDFHLLSHNISLNKFSSKPVTQKQLNSLLNEIRSLYGGSGIELQRRKFVNAQADQFAQDLSKFRDILDNTFIVDDLDETSVRLKISSLLFDLHVPVRKLSQLIKDLTGIVSSNRGNGENVLKLFLDRLQAATTNLPILSPLYREPDDEKVLIDILKKDHVLLLTGVTLCGKTESAFSVAHKFLAADSSIAYYTASGIERAESILTDPINESRLCYLEDPFGHFEYDRVAYNKLKNLLNKKPAEKGRYLIVTANLSLINIASSVMSTAGYRWLDRTVRDRGFLEQVWNGFMLHQHAAAKRVGWIVRQMIHHDPVSNLLQPGQLDYLSRNTDNLPSVTEEAVRHLANVNAGEIAELVSNEPALVKVFILMGVTATTMAGPSMEDLGYIFSDPCPEKRPGIRSSKVLFHSSSLFGTIKAPEYRLNIYEDYPSPPQQVLDSIDRLTELRYIRFKDGQFQFVHPIYQEAARRFFDTTSPIRLADIINLTSKAIGSLNPHIGEYAVRSLYILADYQANDPDKFQNIIKVALDGLMSTFVVVRDHSLLFLLKKYNDLSIEQKRDVNKNVLHRTSVGSFRWENGITFIPDTQEIVTDFLDGLNYWGLDGTLNIWAAYCKSPGNLNFEESWTLLKNLNHITENRKSRIGYEIEPLVIFIHCEESYIREAAAYLIAASITDEKLDIVIDLFNADDPFVHYELVRGMIRSWPYLVSQDNKDRILAIMKEAMGNLFVVLNAIDLFTQFNAGHTSYTFDWMYDIEDKVIPDMWYVWAELLVEVFKVVPPTIDVNDKRFQDTLLKAQVSVDQKLGIFISWMEWLPGHFDYYGYDTIFSELLLSFYTSFFFEIDPIQRIANTEKLLNLGHERFKGQLLRFLVHEWNHINQSEKLFLEGFILKSNTVLQAIVLTTDNIPSDLEKQILGFSQLLGRDGDKIIKTLDKGRLKDIIAVFYVHPSYKFLSYGDSEKWVNVISCLLDHRGHPAFSLALHTLVKDKYMGFDVTFPGVPSDFIEVALKESDEQSREVIFDLLLDELVQNRYFKDIELVAGFFKIISPEEEKKFGELLAINMESIFKNENMKNLPEDIYLKYIQKELAIDEMIHFGTKPSEFVWGDEHLSNFVQFNNYLIKESKLRTPYAIKIYQKWAKENPQYFNKESLEEIEKCMERFNEKVSRQRRAVEIDSLNRLLSFIGGI